MVVFKNFKDYHVKDGLNLFPIYPMTELGTIKSNMRVPACKHQAVLPVTHEKIVIDDK